MTMRRVARSIRRLLFHLVLWWRYPAESGTCANRSWERWRWRSGKREKYEVTLTIRRLTEVDGYSRTELVEMLRTVRVHERAMGWRVPEPS